MSTELRILAMLKCIAQARAIVAAYRAELPDGFDPQASIVSGTVGAVLGADAQGDATKANRKNTQETNALNLEQFLRARGSAGDAVLPTYLRTPEGKKWEPTFARDLQQLYAMTMPKPAKTLRELRATRDAYMPLQQAAADEVRGIFNGDVENTLLSDYQPVQEARETLGKNRTAFRRQAAIDALNKTLSEIDATQAGKGYTGDSLSHRMMEFGARKSAADDESAARLLEDSDRLLTAQELQAIKDYARVQLPLASVNLPGQLLEQGISMNTLPERALLDFQSARMQPLTFLRIGAGQPFQHMPMPLVSAVGSPWQYLAQGSAAAGNMAADYFMKRDLAQQMRTQQPQRPAAAAPSNYPMPAAVPQANTWQGADYSYMNYLGMPASGSGAAAGTGGTPVTGAGYDPTFG